MNTRNRIPTVSVHATNGTRNPIFEVLRDTGAFRLEGAFPRQLVERLVKEAEMLFALPEAERSHLKGYTPPGVEGVRGYSSDFLRHFLDDRMGNTPRSDAVQQAFDVLWTRTQYWLQALDREQGTSLSQIAPGGPHMLRRSQYLNKEVSSTVVFPPHRDFGLLTFYIGGVAEGLQMYIDGEWYDVWNPPGSLIVAAGTTLRMYLPDIISVRHQVVARHLGRVSCVFFTEPQPDVILPNGVRASDHLERLVRQIRPNDPGSPVSPKRAGS